MGSCTGDRFTDRRFARAGGRFMVSRDRLSEAHATGKRRQGCKSSSSIIVIAVVMEKERKGREADRRGREGEAEAGS